MTELHPLKLSPISSLLAKAEAKGWLWWVAIFSLFYFPITIVRAASRPMWFDELFTFYISRMDLSKIWAILSSGNEPNPPICYVLTHFSMRMFGENEAAIRLPEVAGFWLMSICVFLFVRHRCSAYAAAAAIFFGLSTKAYVQYAVEARPYGLVLGFCGLAAVCWQYASDGETARVRTLSTIGFCLALMAALCSHYYAVLLLIPFGVGELVRWWKTGRLNITLSAALVASLLPLVLLYPTIKRGSSFITTLVKTSPNFWAKPTIDSTPLFFIEVLATTVVPLLLTAIVVVVFRSLGYDEEENDSATTTSWPPIHETAMVIALVALPAFATVLGRIATGSFIARYALSAVVGCSLVFGLLAYKGTYRRQSIVPAAAAFVFFGWFLGNGLHRPRSVAAQPLPDITSVDRNMPIVIADPLLFLKLVYYAPREFASRMHYLTDLDSVTKKPDFVPELALRQLRTWITVPVDDYKPFVANNHRFAVFSSPEPTLEWVAAKLTADGHSVQMKPITGGGQIFEVTTAAVQ